MKKEIDYSSKVDPKHLKSFGQYFTPSPVAEFMCKWACRDAQTMLDPAAGNSIFLSAARRLHPACSLTGYEIDPTILSYFGNPAEADLIEGDYLLNDWDTRYDAIVGNPPYNRFQSVANRDRISEEIYTHTGQRYSLYTNLYILFLIKSIAQMSDHGRLAYIIPTEFLNSRYGTAIKKQLVEERLLKAILTFHNDADLFFNATTTCCLLLLDRASKDRVYFRNLSSIDELRSIDMDNLDQEYSVSYTHLDPADKWRHYLNREDRMRYSNLVDVSFFCKVTRGIATGDNSFFCMSRSKAAAAGIPAETLARCICRSADVRSAIFTDERFDALAEKDKTVYLLNIKEEIDPDRAACSALSSGSDLSSGSTLSALAHYIAAGEADHIDRKYLLSRRRPWYAMEQKPIAPIWVSSATRSGIKFIRNLAGIHSLTTFHSLFIREPYMDDTDLIFCYFLTPTAQHILRENRKELGNGLDKFQPGDLNSAKMLDIKLLTEKDRHMIHEIYEAIVRTANDKSLSQEMIDVETDALVQALDRIFRAYLIG